MSESNNFPFAERFATKELGLAERIPIAYRAGDQSSNEFLINILDPDRIAINVRTSGVIYGVTDKLEYDKLSRVNSFAHVNYTTEQMRIGVLLCINGT